MGCTSSQPSEANDVDLALVEQRLQELYKFKVLLLGAGESGKSTLTKQLKVIHDLKPTEGELRVVASSLHQNLVDCIKALGVAARTFGYEMGPEVAADFEAISSRPEEELLTPEEGEKIRRLFDSEPFQNAYKRRAEFWLLDSMPYLMDNVTRFATPGFKPTEEDAVMARVRTTGIIESNLEERINSTHGPVSCTYKVVDVGGQRNERKKWIHCFDAVSAILFVVNLGGYNQVMFEDSERNRMLESLELFKGVASNQLFSQIPIYLILNKKDIFETELRHTDLSVCFKDYTGGNDVLAALEHVKSKFRACMPPGKEDLYIEVVTSVYKREIKYAFDEVKQRLFKFHEPRIEKERAELDARRRAIIKSSG